MCVAVIERIVFAFITLRTVIWISRTELKIKEIGMFKVVFARRLWEICYISTVIMVARCHHIRNAFDYAFKPLEHSVPLQLILAVIAVVACSENELAFGVLFQRIFKHVAYHAVIGQVTGSAFLVICDNNKAEFIKAFRLCFEGEILASIFITAYVINVFCASFKSAEPHGIVITDVNIGFFCFVFCVKS